MTRFALKPYVPGEIESMCAAYPHIANHRKVAWLARINSGAMKVDNRYIRFYTGVKTIVDWIGQLYNGRFFAVEWKRLGEKPTKDQQEFLDMVNANGGLAGVAVRIEDVYELLERA